MPKQITEYGAGQREHRRLGQKGAADGGAGGTEGLEQADFGGTLRHRNQHHIHHQNAGHGEADRGDAGDGQRQRAEQFVEGRQHGVLGDDGDVFLPVVALLDDLQHLCFGGFDRVAIAGFDHDAKERVAVEHRLRQRDWHQHQLVAVHAQPLAG